MSNRHRTGHCIAFVFVLLVSATLAQCGTCLENNPCADFPYRFSLVPVPDCRRYVMCFGNIVVRELSCRAGTAFHPTGRVCTPQFHQACLVQEYQSQVQTRLSCPREATVTFYPDYSKGCPSPRYFVCKNGVLFRRICAPGQVFDEGIDMCVTSSTVRCGVTGPVCTEKSRDSTVYANYTFGCPAPKFFICVGGGLGVEFSCPEQLFYNGAVKNCDYADNIVCGDNVPDLSSIRNV